MSSVANNQTGGEHPGYDYRSVIVDNNKVSMYLDSIKIFGWTPDGAIPKRRSRGKVILKLKRDRSIPYIKELVRLQQHYESCIDDITVLENSITTTATLFSIIVGAIGTAFMVAAVFSATIEIPMFFISFVLSAPGIAGWTLSYLLYKHLIIKKAADVAPHIERKYSEIRAICEKSSSLAAEYDALEKEAAEAAANRAW